MSAREIVCVVNGAVVLRVPGTSVAEDRTYAVGFIDGACAAAKGSIAAVYVLPEDAALFAVEHRRVSER